MLEFMKPVRAANDLLWSAPELLRNSELLSRGSQEGDVFAFGIIMQEVILRKAPYVTLNLPSESIVNQIRQGSTIRPNVSTKKAPLDALVIMRNCWSESPDARPKINEIWEQFKRMNDGK